MGSEDVKITVTLKEKGEEFTLASATISDNIANGTVTLSKLGKVKVGDTIEIIAIANEGFTGTFTFEDVAISLATEEFYTYEDTLKIYDIGTTVIDGIDDLIAADQELIDSGLED